MGIDLTMGSENLILLCQKFKLDQALVKHTGYRNHIEVARFDAEHALFLREHSADITVYRQVFESLHLQMRFETDPAVTEI